MSCFGGVGVLLVGVGGGSLGVSGAKVGGDVLRTQRQQALLKYLSR